MRATPHEHRLSFFLFDMYKEAYRMRGAFTITFKPSTTSTERARGFAFWPLHRTAYWGPCLILKGLMGALYNVCVAAIATEREAGEAARGGDTWEGELRAKFRLHERRSHSYGLCGRSYIEVHAFSYSSVFS